MDLVECFKEECVHIGLSAAEKDGILGEIARVAKNSDVLDSYSEEEIYHALRDREKIGSTAFGGGIAVPHCALEGIEDFVVGLVSAPEGAEFDSTDGEPTYLFTFIIAPQNRRNEHVSLLSEISRILDDEKARKEMLDTEKPHVLARSFLRHHRGKVPHQSTKKCLFQVVIQDESVFSDILMTLNEAVEDGDITVVEAHNAGEYLNRLPMFAAFWNEPGGGFCRLIMAVVDEALVNDMVRRINVAVKDLEHRNDVLVTAQELTLVQGGLEF